MYLFSPLSAVCAKLLGFALGSSHGCRDSCSLSTFNHICLPLSFHECLPTALYKERFSNPFWLTLLLKGDTDRLLDSFLTCNISIDPKAKIQTFCGTWKWNLQNYLIFDSVAHSKRMQMLPALSYSFLSLLFSLSPLHVCLSYLSCIIRLLPWVNKFRHLYQSPCCGRRFLWPRLVGSLSLCLLEAVLANLEEQDSVSPCRKWPPCGLPRGTSSQLHSSHRVQSGGDGEKTPAGGESERTEQCEVPWGSYEDQSDVARHPRRGANSPEGEDQQTAHKDPEADDWASILLQVASAAPHTPLYFSKT